MTWINSFSDAGEKAIPEQLVRCRNPTESSPTASELGLQEPRDTGGPLVSIVIPTYRDSEYLPDALESVGEQTHQNLELIVVDSSDVDWVQQVCSACEWSRYVPQPSRGVGAARNVGIARSNGKYIALLDADDYWHPEKVERQLGAMMPDARASFTAHYFIKFWDKEEPIVSLQGRHLQDPATAFRDVLHRRVIPHTSTLMFRKTAVPNRPFREDLQNFEDIVFAVELFRSNPPAHLSAPLSVRRLREGSLAHRTGTDTKLKHRIAAYEQLAESYPELKPDARRMQAEMAYRLGWHQLQQGDRRVARSWFHRSVRTAPSKVKSILLYSATIPPVDGETTARLIERGYRLFSRSVPFVSSGNQRSDPEVSIVRSGDSAGHQHPSN